MSQIQKKFIKDQAVDESKILLLNDGELKARNAADSADVSLFKLDASDVLKMLKLPRIDSMLAAPSDAKDLTPKDYVDQAESDAIASANAYTDGEVATLEAEDLTFLKLDGSRPMEGSLDLATHAVTGSQSVASDTNSLSLDAAEMLLETSFSGGVEAATQIQSGSIKQYQIDTGVTTEIELSNNSIYLSEFGGASDVYNRVVREGEEFKLETSPDNDSWSLAKVQLGEPTQSYHAATKSYVDGEIQEKLTDELGVSIATLVLGKVPVSQLPNAIMEYQGMWDASTNTPALANGAGNADEDIGNVYKVSVAGSHDFGAGSISFEVGDYAILNSSKIWEKSDSSDAVTSVNGQVGIVVLDAGDIAVSPTVEGGSDVQSALENLETAIGALEGASVEFVQEKFVLDSTDISNGYIDLGELAIAASINAYVDRLAIHQTDDYTLSTVGGVTRLTFAGNLISPSEEQVAIGDVVRVKYAKIAI